MHRHAPRAPYPTIWTDLLSTRQAKAHQKEFLPTGVEPFATPKTEQLLQRIVEMCSNRGDWILDSFAGSGTTGAVAHKMGRKWIMVELGEHCHTHLIPRLTKVIDGKDPGGITEAVDWKGGGGFRYYTLAPSLLERDQFGNGSSTRSTTPRCLAKQCASWRVLPTPPAIRPIGSTDIRPSETSFTSPRKRSLASKLKLSDEVGPSRSLVIYCCAFRVRNLDDFPNLTLKKIPKAVLSKCEWGKDDYSLEIKNLPLARTGGAGHRSRRRAIPTPTQGRLAAAGPFRSGGPADEPSRQRHRQPTEPAPAATRLA